MFPFSKPKSLSPLQGIYNMTSGKVISGTMSNPKIESSTVILTKTDGSREEVNLETNCIKEHMFANREDIREAEMSPNIECVSRASFKGCKNLEKVLFSTNLKHIYIEAFRNCPKLESVRLPKYLESVDEMAFDWETTWVQPTSKQTALLLEDFDYMFTSIDKYEKFKGSVFIRSLFWRAIALSVFLYNPFLAMLSIFVWSVLSTINTTLTLSSNINQTSGIVYLYGDDESEKTNFFYKRVQEDCSMWIEDGNKQPVVGYCYALTDTALFTCSRTNQLVMLLSGDVCEEATDLLVKIEQSHPGCFNNESYKKASKYMLDALYYTPLKAFIFGLGECFAFLTNNIITLITCFLIKYIWF
jgi:hypothetical protein